MGRSLCVPLLICGVMFLSGAGCDLHVPGAIRSDTFESTCGNGELDIGEDCDDDVFQTSKCHKGKLVCKPNCLLDKTACTKWCGDSVLSPAEACDGKDFKVACLKGKFKCNKDCTVDKSLCTAWCGDGKILAGKEECDGSAMPANICHLGTVSCGTDCAIDFKQCEEFCGDEVINGTEWCDRSQFHYACHDKSGVLTCNSDCTIIAGNCTKYCGDGVLNNAQEDCDKGVFRDPKPCAAATCLTDCTVDDKPCKP